MYKRLQYLKKSIGHATPDSENKTLGVKVVSDDKRNIGKVNIEFLLGKQTEIKFLLTSVLGKVVYLVKDTYESGKNCIYFSSNQFAKGLYFLEIMLDDRSYVEKVYIS